jgi:hypothetical protein
MNIHLALSAYWLLVPLVIGLALWTFIDRDDEHGGYFSDMSVFFRFFASIIIFLVVLCILLLIHIWTK